MTDDGSDCAACCFFQDCADCQESLRYCTTDCFDETEECTECTTCSIADQAEECIECAPCFDEACCLPECEVLDSCCVAAGPSTICTLEDCPGPSEFDTVCNELANMHRCLTSHSCPDDNDHLARHTTDASATNWSHHAAYRDDDRSQVDLTSFLEPLYHHDQGQFYDCGCDLDNTQTPSLTDYAPSSELSGTPDRSRQSSEAMQSGLSIAAGMSMLYPCRAEDCHESFDDFMQLDQHLLNNHAKRTQADEAVPNANLWPCSDSTHTHHLSPPPPPSLSPHPTAVRLMTQKVPNEGLSQHTKHISDDIREGHLCKWMMRDSSGEQVPCNKCFSSARDLTEHVKFHHVGARKREYICHWQHCERQCKPFPQRQKIEKHLVVHTQDRRFHCTLCDYVAGDLSTLKQHCRTHTGEKPFSCPICHKKFNAQTSLSIHLRLHTGEKPLLCKVPGCNKRFSESSNLSKHMRTHAETRAFKCLEPHCGKAFQRPDQLKRHMKTVHKVLHETIDTDLPVST